MFALRHNINEIPVIMEVGCYEGRSLLDYQNSFKNSYIYGIEANPIQFDILKNKITGLNYKNIRIFNLAIGSAKYKQQFYRFKNSQLSSFIKPNILNDQLEDIINIDIISGDTFCYNHNINEIDILHIDVQGLEYDVLESFKAKIENNLVKVIVIEFDYSNRYSKKTKISDLEFFLHKRGYELLDILLLKRSFISSKDDSGTLYKIKNGLLMFTIKGLYLN